MESTFLSSSAVFPGLTGSLLFTLPFIAAVATTVLGFKNKSTSLEVIAGCLMMGGVAGITILSSAVKTM